MHISIYISISNILKVFNPLISFIHLELYACHQELSFIFYIIYILYLRPLWLDAQDQNIQSIPCQFHDLFMKELAYLYIEVILIVSAHNILMAYLAMCLILSNLHIFYILFVVEGLVMITT